MKPVMIMLIGLPGSGKSSFAKSKEKEGYTVFSSDSIRAELYGDASVQDDPQRVFSILHSRIKEALLLGKNVIYDATNISSKRRMAFLQELKKIPCNKIAYWIWASYETCLARNEERNIKVPEAAIKRMYKRFDPPAWWEGWDDIAFLLTEKDSQTSVDYMLASLMNFSQDNPYHSLSLGEHLRQTCSNVGNIVEENFLPFPTEIYYAALLHDIGKPFTKQFIDNKGNITDIAHYYHHENTGSYDVFKFYQDMSDHCDILEVACLIRYHMRPYILGYKGSKAEKKDRELWGEEFFNKIQIIHKADERAH